MKNTDDGFTLVEVMVALTLFVLVAGAATFAIVSAMRAANSTDQRVAAGSVAQQELDRVRALGPDPALTSRPVPTAVPFTSGDGRRYTITVTAAPDWAVNCAIGTGVGYRDLTVMVSVATGQVSPVYLDSRISCTKTVTP